jgi:TonB family protein
MPNTPIQPGSPAIAERRRHERLQPSGLVYLDIGAENGGIVLDLTEDGAGVQAVAPLAVLSKIPVRFQLPDSPKRVQAEAQVAWVSESRRRVGLHFTDIADDVRGQIRDWLQSQAGGSTDPTTEVAARVPAGADGPLPAAPNGEWLSSPGESSSREDNGGGFHLHENALNAPAEASFNQDGDTPRTLLRELIEEVAPSTADTETEISYRGMDLALAASGGQTPTDDDAFEPNAREVERAEVIHWPEIAPATDPAAEPAALKSAAIPVAKPSIPASAVEKPPVSSVLTRPAMANSGGLWKIAIAVVILLAASFEAGTWLGRGHVSIAPPDPVHAPVQGLDSRADHQQPPAVTREEQLPRLREHRGEHSRDNLVAPQASSPAPNVATAPLAKSANAPPSPPALPNAPVVSIDAARAAQVAPVAPDTAASAQLPATPVVDGPVLTATDRFNPAHLIYHFAPDYPAEAKQQNVQGTVKLHLSIDASGAVNQVRLLSGPSLLVPAAISAVRDWRYLPALLNGEPVKSEQDVSVDFRLPADR